MVTERVQLRLATFAVASAARERQRPPQPPTQCDLKAQRLYTRFKRRGQRSHPNARAGPDLGQQQRTTRRVSSRPHRLLRKENFERRRQAKLPGATPLSGIRVINIGVIWGLSPLQGFMPTGQATGIVIDQGITAIDCFLQTGASLNTLKAFELDLLT